MYDHLKRKKLPQDSDVTMIKQNSLIHSFVKSSYRSVQSQVLLINELCYYKKTMWLGPWLSLNWLNSLLSHLTAHRALSSRHSNPLHCSNRKLTKSYVFTEYLYHINMNYIKWILTDFSTNFYGLLIQWNDLFIYNKHETYMNLSWLPQFLLNLISFLNSFGLCTRFYNHNIA